MKERLLDELNATYLDVLTEIGNIGSGNAATALADMLNKKVEIDPPKVMLLNYGEVAKLLGGPESMVISMMVGLEADLQGMMLHIVSPEFANNMINTYYPREIHSLDDITEMDLSVMQEMSNITTAAYVNSVATMAEMFINITPPNVSVDRVSRILDKARDDIGLAAQQVLYIDDNFIIGGTQIKSTMIMIVTLDSLNVLFKRLGIDM